MIISRSDGAPHRTNTELYCDNSYKPLALLCLHRGALRRNCPAAPRAKPGALWPIEQPTRQGQNLYLPAYFEESRTEVMHALMRARPLAALVTLSDTGLIANHVPVETLPEPLPHGMLRGHIARANPLWRTSRADSEALAIFQGPQAYISPSFYPTKQETGEVVPTWDYAVVHASGTLRFVQDSDWLRALVSRLTNAHEVSRQMPWKIDDAPPPYLEKMLSLIVGFEFSIASLSGKWKLSQNHPTANRLGVVKGLRDAGGAESLEVADLVSSLENERQDEPHD